MEEGEFISKVPNTVQQVITDDVTTATKFLYKDTGKRCTTALLFYWTAVLERKKIIKNPAGT